MNNYTIYCHISPNGKKYVGISNNPLKRWNNGNGYIKNKLFFQDIIKYGWDNFQHIFLQSNLSIEEAKNLERQFIKNWNLTNEKYGYNLREGGNGPLSTYSKQLISLSNLNNKKCQGRILTSSTKEKISTSLKRYYATHQNPFLNKHHTEETINKLKNKKVSEETREKMRKNHADVAGKKNPSAKAIKQLDLNGNLLATFEYATLAAKTFNLDLSSIIKCCRGKQKTCGGYKWEYLNI